MLRVNLWSAHIPPIDGTAGMSVPASSLFAVFQRDLSSAGHHPIKGSRRSMDATYVEMCYFFTAAAKRSSLRRKRPFFFPLPNSGRQQYQAIYLSDPRDEFAKLSGGVDEAAARSGIQ